MLTSTVMFGSTNSGSSSGVILSRTTPRSLSTNGPTCVSVPRKGRSG